MNTPELNTKVCCNTDQKIKTVFNKQCRLDFLGFESNGSVEPNTLLYSIYMDSVFLLSVLSFSDGLNLFKQVGVTLCITHFTRDLSGVFKLTTSL